MSTEPDTTLTTSWAGARIVDDAGNTMPVCEVFTTVQGEGPYTGHRAVFARLGRCNLSCTWCDTPYTWDETRHDVAAECPDVGVVELADRILEPTRVHGAGLVVLTGGEPMMHQHRPGFRLLLDMLRADGVVVHVETNGTITPSPTVVAKVGLFVVSPKLANNGADPARRRLKRAALMAFTDLARQGRAVFKFVATGRGDLVEVDDLTATYQIPTSAVWVMPEGTDTDTVLARHQDLAGPVIARGWNTTSRLHVLLWGAERGR